MSRVGAEDRPAPAKLERGAGEQLGVTMEPSALALALGTEDPDFAGRLLSQLLSVLHPDASKPLAQETLDSALAMLRAIGPRDGLEAQLAIQMVGCHIAAMDGLRRALHPAQTTGGRALYGSLAGRLMRTFAAQLDALNRGRGKGTVQRVIVERVTVESGAQAVVGAVTAERRGDG